MKANLGSAQLQPLDGPPGFLVIFTSSENLQKEEKAFWRITMATPEDDDLIHTKKYKSLDGVGCMQLKSGRATEHGGAQHASR